MRNLPIASDRRYYVSLGDAQSRNAEGYLGAASRFYDRLAALDSALKMVPLATDGATAATVRYVQLPRLREMNAVPSVITLTLGASYLSRLAFGDAAGVCRELGEHGEASLAELRTGAPNAALLLATLYDPMDGTDAVLTDGVRRFNEKLRALGAAHKAVVADVAAAFTGHGAEVGDPLSPSGTVGSPDLYLCAGADMAPVPNEQGAAVFAGLLFASATAPI